MSRWLNGGPTPRRMCKAPVKWRPVSLGQGLGRVQVNQASPGAEGDHSHWLLPPWELFITGPIENLLLSLSLVDCYQGLLSSDLQWTETHCRLTRAEIHAYVVEL